MNGAVLSGGRSTRMGRDKALLPIQGIPMALRMAGILKGGGCNDIHLVGRQQALAQFGLPIIVDGSPTHHPLIGVSAALTTIPGQHVLIAPCDLINIEPSHVERMLRFGAPCVAICEGQLHPLFAVVPTQWSTKATELAQQGAPAMALTGSLPRIDLPAGALFDANTPADLVR